TTRYKTIRSQPNHKHRGLPGQKLTSQLLLNPKLLTRPNRLNTLGGHSLPLLTPTRLDRSNHHIMVLTSRRLAAHNLLDTHNQLATHSRSRNSTRFRLSLALSKISMPRHSTRANNPVNTCCRPGSLPRLISAPAVPGAY